MPTNASKNVKKGTRGVSGPAGTASQRATKSGTRGIKGRKSAADVAKHATPSKMLPDSQGR